MFVPNKKSPNKPLRTSKQQLIAIKRFFFRKRTLVITLILFLLWLPYDLYLGGNIRFYTTWAKCGERPVALVDGSGFFGGGVPHYYEPAGINLLRGPIDYKCSAHEAELDAYSARETTHLTKNENLKVRRKYLLP